MTTHSPKFNSHEAFAEWFNDNICDICDLEEQGKDPEEVMKSWCSKNNHRYEEDGVYNDNIRETKFTLTEIISAWYQCYGESLEDDYDGFIQTLKDPTWEEPCDRCPSQSMSWCQSNGCPRESEDEEPIHADEDEDGDIYCGGCSKFRSVSDFERDLKDAYCIECEEDSDEEEEEVDSFIYNSYKCKHSDCDYETLNTDPDCIKCGKEYCMLAQSNEGTIEHESEDEEQEWCEVGEHHVDKDEMWPDFGDCQECCSEKEYLERTGGTKKKKIIFNVKK